MVKMKRFFLRPHAHRVIPTTSDVSLGILGRWCHEMRLRGDTSVAGNA
jgi:hypothetical protein